MDALTRIALAGTARAAQGSGTAVATGTPVDDLLARLPDGGPERKLLLAAGALTVYRQAGRSPLSNVAAPEPAPAERLPACPPDAARLIGEMLAGQHAELLPEALALLRRAGRRLPPELLPVALTAGARRAELRPVLLAVLGERGRWLSRFDPDWRWLEAVPRARDDAGGVPPDAGTVWEEGSPGQRLAVLRLVRVEDPPRGRDWLAAVWKGEKADFRAAALAALAAGLSLADEPFLEAALDDRSQGVRAGAAALLARLPGSALAARMRARADAMLDYAAPVRGGGLRALVRAVTGGARGRLVVTPPETLDKAWQRDGIAEKPPAQLGERAWWLMRTLEHVPLEHWEERFAASPRELTEAAAHDDWGLTVIEGWTRAAIAAKNGAWAGLLWGWWYQVETKDARYSTVIPELLRALIGCMPPEDVWRSAERLVGDNARRSDVRWIELLRAIPAPWSVRLGERYLQILRDRVRDLRSREYDPWIRTLPIAAPALPPACFAAALRDWELPGSPNLQPRVADVLRRHLEAIWLPEWRRELDRFTATIQTRQRLQQLMEEIAG